MPVPFADLQLQYQTIKSEIDEAAGTKIVILSAEVKSGVRIGRRHDVPARAATADAVE